MILFLLLGTIALVAAVTAVSLRNLVHCALSMTVAFAAIAGIYLQLQAEFLGFAQVLVYLGAVAILIVFAILLTRGIEPEALPSRGKLGGIAVAALVFGFAARMILTSDLGGAKAQEMESVPVRHMGDQLMSRYVLPLEVVGVLLTAAMIGAILLAGTRRKNA